MTHTVHHQFLTRGLIAATCVALVLASGCSNRRSEQHRGEGDTLLKLGRIAEAREAYLISESTNPENPMAQLGLARCAAAQGDVDPALALYEKALLLDPTLEAPYVESVRMLAEANRVTEALERAATYRDGQPLAGGLLYSAVLLKAERPEEAIAALEKLYEVYPESEEVAVNLGVAYADGGKPALAEPLLEPLAGSESPVAPAARMALIEVYQAQGKLDELVAQFEALAMASPDNVDLQLGYARSLLIADRPEEAEAIAREIIAREPTSGWANYIVGTLKMRQEKFEEAAAFLETALVAMPEDAELIALLNAAKSGKIPQTMAGGATATATPAAMTPATAATWRDLWRQAALPRLLANRQAFLDEGGEEARDFLVLAALFSRDGGALRELVAGLADTSPVAGYIKALESRDSEQVSDYFSQWNPDEPELLLARDNALAYAMAALGARGKALSVYLFCLERWPDNMVALYNIAQVFRSVKQPIIAAQQLQRLVVRYPENIDAHQMLYNALREARAFDQARKSAEASYGLFPEEKWSALSLTQAYLDTGEPELALKVLGRASSLYPGDPEIELATASVLVRLGDCARGVELLEGIATTAPQVAGARAALIALCAVQTGDWNKVIEVAGTVDGGAQPLTLRLLQSLAYWKQGDSARAAEILSALDSGEPEGGSIGRIMLAATGANPDGLADEEKAWAKQLGDDREFFLDYATAYVLDVAGLHAAAWNLYQERLAARPQHVALARLAFSILENLGDAAQIQAECPKVVEGLEDDARVWLGLAAVFGSTGDTAGQREALDKAAEIGPENPEVWFKRGVFLERQGDIAGAADSYRNLIALQPDSAAANNNLAYMLLQLGGQDKEALERARAASEKLPGSPDVLHTLGLAQMRTGDLEGSKISLTQATEIDPANPTIMFDYGRVLVELGETDEARDRLRYALAMCVRAGIEFPQLAEAESLLAQLQ